MPTSLRFPIKLAVVGLFITVLDPTPANGAKCVTPGQDLASVVNRALPGSTICISPGTYRPSASLHPLSHVTIEGTSTRGKVQIKASGLQIVVDLRGTWGVILKNLSISGAVNRCPTHNCGATGDGINGGADVRLDNVRVYANGRTGVAGLSGTLTVTHSRFDHNGSAASGPDFVSAGIKSIEPLTVIDSRVDHNQGNGIHCDRDCGAFKVVRSVIKFNTLTGIHVELDRGPSRIAHNIIQNNNTLTWLYHAGIEVDDSKNVDVYGNVLGSNGHKGIHLREDARVNQTGYHLVNVAVHDNIRHHDAIGDCSYAGVSCY